MKVVDLIRKIGFKMVSALSLSMISLSAFADTNASDDTSMSVSKLVASVQGLSGNAAMIVATVGTVAGVILILKGLVHLKQNYGGSSQEKHLSKGVASLGFGAALILAVPIAHMLTSSVDTGSANSFNVGVGAVDLNQDNS
ncbi:MAG: hypothetical protein NTV32_04095 [Gammaproteobacteria bacterium]|jgi:hypothetical protein|nr:hypothetical protein [Gammaproteobacteria bacterium]